MIIDLLFRLYIIIIRKSWFEGLRGGGPRRLAKNRFRTDSIRYLTILASIRIDTRYRVFLPSLEAAFVRAVYVEESALSVVPDPEAVGVLGLIEGLPELTKRIVVFRQAVHS
jgi:hypothetical protein